MKIAVALIGAASREFGPTTVDDLLASPALGECELDLRLMDVHAGELERTYQYARKRAGEKGQKIQLSRTTELEKALEGADFVVSSIEINRYFYWSQDFHIPRQFGFRQIYGENGGPGGLFHALRNFQPMLQIARTMEKVCPDAWLLNYTNPLTKLCQMLHEFTSVRVMGLCHGILDGLMQVAFLMDMPAHQLNGQVSGINHFSWFQRIWHQESGEDLYPRFRELERKAHWLARWDDLALNRILFRVIGLYPSPGTNHIGEYIGWADEFLASALMQYFYDPREEDPWKGGEVPTFIYNLDVNPTGIPPHPGQAVKTCYPDISKEKPPAGLVTWELAAPIIEGLALGIDRDLPAINVPNQGSLVPGLPEDCIVEVPGKIRQGQLLPVAMPPLPEAALAFLRPQISINKLLVQAYREKSREPLLQAILLDPVTPSYRNAVHLINRMFELQQDVLPNLEWQRK